MTRRKIQPPMKRPGSADMDDPPHGGSLSDTFKSLVDDRLPQHSIPDLEPSAKLDTHQPELPMHPHDWTRTLTQFLDVDSTPKPKPKDDTQIVHASLLILGPSSSKPLEHASVVLQSGRITWVGPTCSLPSSFKNLPCTTVPVLMPGMWDAHVHLIGLTSFNFQQILNVPDVAKGVRLARNCHDLLMSGFTSVRDLGGSGCEVAKIIEDETSGCPGPNIYGAGSALSQTAGHGDVFDVSPGTAYGKLGVDALCANGGWMGGAGLCLADGLDECRKAVRLQVRRGAKCIKVFASGGVLSIADDPLRQQFSDEELSVIVEEAGRMGRTVAAHCHGKAGIMAALKAGVGSIEHGTYLDEECCEIMKKKAVVYVPTRTIVVEGLKHPELMSPESYEKMKKVGADHIKAYQLAVSSGVKIVLGTDSGISTPGTGLSLGASGSELVYAVRDGGMSELEAIEAATANGPLCLGGLGMAPKAGKIELGYDADLIAVAESPLDDIKVLRDVEKITHVWKSGKMIKGPGTKRFW